MGPYLQVIFVAITFAGIGIIAGATWWMLTYFYPLPPSHPLSQTVVEGTITSSSGVSK